MIQFVQSYGLWIALVGVFFAMHWFGMGCCGGGHRQRPARRREESLSEGQKNEGNSRTEPTSNGSCH